MPQRHLRSFTEEQENYVKGSRQKAGKRLGDRNKKTSEHLRARENVYKRDRRPVVLDVDFDEDLEY